MGRIAISEADIAKITTGTAATAGDQIEANTYSVCKKMGSVCDDISEFLESLKKMRFVDDKIVYALNTSIPTESFVGKVDATAKCKDLFTQLVNNHTSRDEALQQCLKITVQKVQKLKSERDANPNDYEIIKSLKKEQFKLRELQTQVNVEEVIRGRSLKLYYERCRPFYKPPDTNPTSGL